MMRRIGMIVVTKARMRTPVKLPIKRLGKGPGMGRGRGRRGRVRVRVRGRERRVMEDKIHLYMAQKPTGQ